MHWEEDLGLQVEGRLYGFLRRHMNLWPLRIVLPALKHGDVERTQLRSNLLEGAIKTGVTTEKHSLSAGLNDK
ncbi:hypothetical protein D3C83_212230 [compost metagenome]